MRTWLKTSSFWVPPQSSKNIFYPTLLRWKAGLECALSIIVKPLLNFQSNHTSDTFILWGMEKWPKIRKIYKQKRGNIS